MNEQDVKAKGSMTEGNLLWVILAMAAPITAANLAQSIQQLIDAYFVGKLGAAPIAAIAASGPLIGIIISFGVGLSTAGAILVAQNIGAKARGAANFSAAQTLLMVTIVAFMFAIIGFLVSPYILRWIGVEPDVFDLTWDYLSVAYIGMTPIFGFLTLQAMLQSAGEVKYAMKVMLFSVVLNIILDPILIFGVGSWDGWGVMGASLATVLASVAAYVILLLHVLNGKSVLHLRREDFKPNWVFFKKAFKIGFPASIETGSRTFGALFLMTLAAMFGTISLASYGVGVRPIMFWFAPMMGLSIATSAVVGQNIGAGLMDRASEAAKVSSWIGFIGFSILGLIHLPFLTQVMMALAPGEQEVIDGAVLFTLICLPFLGFFAVAQSLCGVFRGAGSTMLAMKISLIMQYVFQVPFAWGVAKFTDLGVMAIYWSYPVSNVAATLVGLYILRQGKWRKRLVD